MMSLDQRFWSKVNKRSDEECWEWQAALNAYGYGWFGIGKNKATTAHRVSAWLSGVLPTLEHSLHVLHKCDNRKCCNPSHFFLGGNKENVADRVAKGRNGIVRFYGEFNPAAKLTEAQVVEIKMMYSSKKFSQSMLAKQFNVRQPHISRIVNGVRRGGVF